MNPEDLLNSMQFQYKDLSQWATNITISDPRIGCSIHTKTPVKLMPAIPRIENVIFNPPCTIIVWEDKTKTIVRCHEEEFSEEHGFAMAVIKKLFGTRTEYLNIIAKADRQPKVEKKVKKAK
jgi:hypothetical protein